MYGGADLSSPAISFVLTAPVHPSTLIDYCGKTIHQTGVSVNANDLQYPFKYNMNYLRFKQNNLPKCH